MARGEGIAAGEKLKLSKKGGKDRELRELWPFQPCLRPGKKLFPRGGRRGEMIGLHNIYHRTMLI